MVLRCQQPLRRNQPDHSQTLQPLVPITRYYSRLNAKTVRWHAIAFLVSQLDAILNALIPCRQATAALQSLDLGSLIDFQHSRALEISQKQS